MGTRVVTSGLYDGGSGGKDYTVEFGESIPTSKYWVLIDGSSSYGSSRLVSKDISSCVINCKGMTSFQVLTNA